MEGDEYFVALILRDDEHDDDLTVFPNDVLVEEAGDDATRQNLIDKLVHDTNEEWGRNFTLLSAFVTRNIPFGEPTECEVELTYQGKFGMSETINEVTRLTRLADTFVISPDFTLDDAFAELAERANELGLHAAYIYNYSPIRF